MRYYLRCRIFEQKILLYRLEEQLKQQQLELLYHTVV